MLILKMLFVSLRVRHHGLTDGAHRFEAGHGSLFLVCEAIPSLEQLIEIIKTITPLFFSLLAFLALQLFRQPFVGTESFADPEPWSG